MITRSDLRRIAHEQGLSGRILCVHSSYKSFGGFETGPEGLVRALLLEGCTLLVPTFNYAYEAPFPEGRQVRMWMAGMGQRLMPMVQKAALAAFLLWFAFTARRIRQVLTSAIHPGP